MISSSQRRPRGAHETSPSFGALRLQIVSGCPVGQEDFALALKEAADSVDRSVGLADSS
jgi:hypothetical protein